ncbi:hypothetical protein [Acinetobacter puyangensis]|uniref:hypothetical protein n=1 Tax=Acinetobacter puyangensis TaxID=1096779 RepID=UPI003A4E38C0
MKNWIGFKEMSKTYRVKTPYVTMIQKAHIDFIVQTRLPIDEADIVNALIDKYLRELKADDVIEWQKKFNEK